MYTIFPNFSSPVWKNFLKEGIFLKINGIICEYNPFHKGHQKQIQLLKRDPNNAIVCLMSGNFVQRGMPAIFDKQDRAKAAVLCGADLVLELPVTAALSSAEGFAAEGVRILGSFCQSLCFGAECSDPEQLLQIADALLSDIFPYHLATQLEKGLSFPAARQKALEAIGLGADLLSQPNNILAVEYCKAIIAQNSKMKPYPILRQGDYHAKTPDTKNPSATFLRQQLLTNSDWRSFIPKEAQCCFDAAPLYTMQAGERAVLTRLRTMGDSDFEALPYGSEGLWRKLMHAARQCSTLDEILTATKSKRYTRTRLDRMVMCAYLGITAADIASPAPYVRVLAFNDTGREILKAARSNGQFINLGQSMDSPYQSLENRCDDLYGLFRTDSPACAGIEKQRRIYYHQNL